MHGVFLYLSLDIRVNGVPLDMWFVSYYCILGFYCLHCSDYVCTNDPIAFLNPILVHGSTGYKGGLDLADQVALPTGYQDPKYCGIV